MRSGRGVPAARHRVWAFVFLAVLLQGCHHRAPAAAPEYYRRGLSFEKQGRAWQAVVNYRQALDLDPKNVEIRLRLSDLLVDTGDYRSADRNYRAVLAQEPANSHALNNLSWLYAVEGRQLEWALEAMKPLAESQSPHRHVYLDTLGMVYLKMHKYREATAAFEEAVNLCDKGVVLSTRVECSQIKEHLAAARVR